ncbi:MAG: protein-disulfide reductase DsbD domain-containing protein, partial [Planctomycetaceae bacterium]
MRIRHDIFNTPNKVKPTITNQPTPTSYAQYPEGKNLGKTMPMWRVQTEGYETHQGQLIGVVSGYDGFLDSPDVEWISSGANSKGPKSVALGRHGNFFHWGFAASPTYLTDEAKDVFVNAVHYIAKFDRQAPIARKTKGTMMRSAIDSAIESMSDESYAETVAFYEMRRTDWKKQIAEIRKRIEAGEDVPERERRMLESPLPEAPPRMSRVMRFIPEDRAEEFEGKPEKATAYLKKIKPFVRPSGYYELEVDEELMELGIANSDIKVLEKGIELLNTDQKELGQRLLERYTGQSFKTQEAWPNWFKANRQKLFFTEAGGYKWLVNTLDSSKKRVPRKAVRATRKTPFAADMSVEPGSDGRCTLRVDIDILDGWHAYDRTPPNSAYVPLKWSLKLPDGVKQVGKWKKPRGRFSTENPGLTQFEGRLKFSCELSANATAKVEEIECSVRYQICDDQRCLRPTT